MSNLNKAAPQSLELTFLSEAFIKLCQEAGWDNNTQIVNKLKLSLPTIHFIRKASRFPLSSTLLHKGVHKVFAKHAPKGWADPAIGGNLKDYIEKGQLPTITEPTTKIDPLETDKTKNSPSEKQIKTSFTGGPPPYSPSCKELCIAFLTLCTEAGWHTKAQQSKNLSIYYQGITAVHECARFPSPDVFKCSKAAQVFAQHAPQSWATPSIGGILYDYIESGILPDVVPAENSTSVTPEYFIEEPLFDSDGLPPELSQGTMVPYGQDPFATPVTADQTPFLSLPIEPPPLQPQPERAPCTRAKIKHIKKENPPISFKQAQESLCENLYAPIDGQINFRDVTLCLKDVLQTHLDQTPATNQDWKHWRSLLRYMEEKPVIPKPSFLILLGIQDVLAAPYNINAPQVPLLIDYIFPDLDRKQAALRKLAVDIHHKVGATRGQAYLSKPTPLSSSFRP